jgi:hypothetical protein
MTRVALRAALMAPLAFTVPLAPALLTGCATTTTNGSPATTTALSLAQIQAEVASIDAATQASNAIFQASTSPTQAQKALAAESAQALAGIAATVAGLPSSSAVTAQSTLAEFVGAAQKLVPILAPVLAVNPATAALLSLGIAMVQAFAGGVALPVSVQAPVGAIPGVVAAPVAVPLPTVPAA